MYVPQKGVLLLSHRHRHETCTCGRGQIPALEEVANRPIVHHVLDALRSAGVQEVVVAGPADVLIDVRPCLSSYPPTLRLDYVVYGESPSTLAGLRATLPLVGAAPCIVHVGDGLLGEPLGPYVEALGRNSLDLVLLCQRSPLGAPSRNLIEVEAPLRALPRLPGDAGVGVFGPGAFRQACEADAAGAPVGLGELAQHLSDRGGQVDVSLAEGWRRYRGNPKDLLEVNRLALDLLAPQLRPALDGQSRIEGRVQIDRTAKVTTSVIVGPVVVGEGAEITNAYVGPYTSIGSGARIEGVEIERSIIAPGACVMHVGARLVSSVVGRGAHVFRDFSLPRAMRLQVAAGDEVAVC